MTEMLPIFIFNSLSSIFHGILFVIGLLVLKYTKNWLQVFGLIAVFIVAHVLLTFGTFFFQGSERAWSMILPGGEMFAVMGLPVIISSVITTSMIMFAANILFVETGNQEHV